MSGYNPNIELTVADMKLIEDSLRQTKRHLSQPSSHDEEAAMVGASVREIDDLLGRLHNQKVFFRPRKEPYVSG
ncbi:MAG: hypothetical protein Q4P24_04630 [Rhodobacterales bacterium]|nr:hypothetical protein [Rhodobacterales bacterium]